MDNYLRILADAVRLIRSHGARSIFVVQIGKRHRPENVSWPSYSSRGAGLARELGVQVIDPTSAFQAMPGDDDDLFDPAVHVTAKGGDLLARQIVHALLP